MSGLTVEIYGTGTHNRGAQLMALATAQHLTSSFPKCTITVPPEFGTLADIYHNNFNITEDFSYRKINTLYIRLMPRNLRRKFAFTKPSDIDVVLDASGFSLSDQWGPLPARRLAKRMLTRTRKSQPLVLLPQALGPFHTDSVSRAAHTLFRRTELIFARDKNSLQFLQRFDMESKCHIAPDFTLTLTPRMAQLNLPAVAFGAIVPNMRMLDKTHLRTEYLRLLSNMPNLLRKYGLQPVIVIHDAHEDLKIVELVGASLGTLPCITHDDPLVLKWALGKASVVVGSRFHALVSALSQGVPAIGVGWSHKYAQLFAGFGCDEMYLTDFSDDRTLDGLLERVTDSTTRSGMVARIQSCVRAQQAATDAMWSRVDKIVGRYA